MADVLDPCGFCGTQHKHPTPQWDLPYPSPPGFNDTQHDMCSISLAFWVDAIPNAGGWLSPWEQLDR